MTVQAVWHNDGHIIRLGLRESQVEVIGTVCPRGDCQHPDTACVVEWFLDNYGLEINVGSCPIDGDIQVAWAFIESSRDLDGCQVWIIPVTDPVFSAWNDYQETTYGDGQ